MLILCMCLVYVPHKNSGNDIKRPPNKKKAKSQNYARDKQRPLHYTCKSPLVP